MIKWFNSNLIILQTNHYFKPNEINDLDRDMWTESDFSEFDYGLLGLFYYNINENLLATVEGYKGLSKFSEDNDEEMTGNPNVFHYINLGIAYKFGGKSK